MRGGPSSSRRLRFAVIVVLLLACGPLSVVLYERSLHAGVRHTVRGSGLRRAGAFSVSAKQHDHAVSAIEAWHRKEEARERVEGVTKEALQEEAAGHAELARMHEAQAHLVQEHLRGDGSETWAAEELRDYELAKKHRAEAGGGGGLPPGLR